MAADAVHRAGPGCPSFRLAEHHPVRNHGGAQLDAAFRASDGHQGLRDLAVYVAEALAPTNG